MRSLDSLTAQPLAGTDGASYPFWSPDSRYIGFFADGKLKKVEATGGPPQALCDAPNGRGGTWNRDGAILFGSQANVLSRVPAEGGEAKLASSGRWPVFLPDGRHFPYTAPSRGTVCIYIGALDSKDRTPFAG